MVFWKQQAVDANVPGTANLSESELMLKCILIFGCYFLLVAVLTSWTNLDPQALEAIEEELKSGRISGSKLSELTSKFYTIIPHDFGRRVPPVIRDAETLQKKFDMLLVSMLAADQIWSTCIVISRQVLGDIEIAQGIERDKEKKQKEVRVWVLNNEANYPLSLPPLPTPSPYLLH